MLGLSDLPLVIAVLIGASMLFSWWQRRNAPDAASLEEVRAALASGARLVDVRSRAEFRAGHSKKALNIPVGELSRRLGELGSRQRPVVICCQSGFRSRRAARVLQRAGFEQVMDLGRCQNAKG